MNKLEEAILSASDDRLDFYLESMTTKEVRADIEEIKRKAAMTTSDGRLKLAILNVIEEAESD